MLGKAIWRLRIQENTSAAGTPPPDPAEGTYNAPANPLVGGEGLAVPSPRTPSPALVPSGLASPTPTPKLVPTPLGMENAELESNRPTWGLENSRSRWKVVWARWLLAQSCYLTFNIASNLYLLFILLPTSSECKKNWMLVFWWCWLDWSFARLIAPVVQLSPLTTSIILCFNKHRLIQVHLENGR